MTISLDLVECSIGLAMEFRSEKIPRNRLGMGFLYSAEENAHSEGIPKFTEEPIPKLGAEQNYAEKISFTK